ncbi:CHAT domain-containing protein [Nostoc sp. CCY 9925]|uniref:CHAT domain-containing protein n=1 Tax=Nostoc sp. CCY 9925 TaxID=3103865 RepID=UPI0039C6D9CD
MRLLYVVKKTGIKALPLLTFLLFLVIQPRNDQASALLNLKASSGSKISLLRGIQEEQSIQEIFKDAGWIFYPDGKFIFIPSQVNSSRVKLPPISGTYTQFEDRLEFQAEQQSSSLRVSLDGVIRKDDEHWVLDAIYTNSSWQDPRQIARVTQQSLTQLPPGTVKQPAIEKTPVSQPLPAAIKIPIRIFDVTFEGKTEAGAFSRLPGFLFITLGKDERLSNVSFLVDPDLPITHGKFNWSTGDLPNPSIQIQGNISSQLQIEFKPGKKMGAIAWWTLPSVRSTSTDPVPVMGEAATAMLSIQGEQVTGEVHARGISPYDDQPSTYEAKITGRIQKSQLTEQLRTSLNASGFNGRWNTSGEEKGKEFGQIEFEMNGQQVRGTFKGQGSGTIEGRIVSQNRLEFTWKDNQRGQGKGFLRLIGGTLVGLWNTQDSKTASPLIATWQLPASLSTQALTPLDIKYLRRLGDELGSEGRCEQAEALLDKVFTFYRDERHKGTVSLFEQQWNALSESWNLSLTSIPCNFQLGDYDNLVDSLNHYADIQLFLQPETSAGRLYRQRTASLTKHLKSSLKTLAILQNGFAEMKKLASGNHFIGIIGIGLEKDETTQNLVIWKVFKGNPAEKAGILPQDILLKINGRSTEGMNDDQASEKLRGAPDTPVTVTVRRANQEIDFKLVRDQEEIYPVARQEEFIQALTFRVNYLANLQARLKTQLEQLADIETKISQRQADPVEAWITLTKILKSQKAQLDSETDDIFAQERILHKGQTALALLQDFDTIIQAFPRDCDAYKLNEINISQARYLEKRIEQTLESSHNLTLVEKTLFGGNLYLALPLYSLSVELDCEHKTLAKTDAKKQFEDNKRQATETANKLDRDIERWRKKLVDDAPKIEALDKGQPFFQKLISLLVELGDEKGALVASEKSRARALADLLATRLSTTSTQTSAESPTLEQIQKIARTQAATLVQYSIIENAGKEPYLFIWVVQPTGQVNFKQVSLKSLEQKKTTLESLIAETRKAIFEQRDNSQANNPTAYFQQLHELLIQPISELLPSDPNAHIIFIPQKDLFLVPFPALLDADGKYLIEKHTILTAPSIQALDSTHRLRQQNAGVSKQNLVVGNPVYAPRPKPLDDLKNWEQGAKDIAAQLNTQAIIGRDATKATILKLLPQARIIHLATHSGFDEEHPLDSWIALTPEGSNDNGELTAGKLLNLYAPPKGSPLHAELIVLAACETGQGKITGDGVNGLSRSLIAAGIPSAVVSLWSVNEVPTIFLMKEFYKALPSGKAQALRQAMLATMKEYPNQVTTWAGFTLIGEAK